MIVEKFQNMDGNSEGRRWILDMLEILEKFQSLAHLAPWPWVDNGPANVVTFCSLALARFDVSSEDGLSPSRGYLGYLGAVRFC